MTDDTDRVLASIDEAIDGYVSEDWTVGDDAMRWRPEEPELTTPVWTAFSWLADCLIVRPPEDPPDESAAWCGMYPTWAIVDECQGFLIHAYAPRFSQTALDLYWGVTGTHPKKKRGKSHAGTAA